VRVDIGANPDFTIDLSRRDWLGDSVERARRGGDPLHRAQCNAASLGRHAITNTTGEIVANAGLKLGVIPLRRQANGRPANRLAALRPRLLGATHAGTDTLLDHCPLDLLVRQCAIALRARLHCF
jgi:hypothetical protein